jgi:hypothetical protein
MFGDEKEKHGDERMMGIDKERREIKRIGERLFRAKDKGKRNNIGQMKNNLGNLKRIVAALPQRSFLRSGERARDCPMWHHRGCWF